MAGYAVAVAVLLILAEVGRWVASWRAATWRRASLADSAARARADAYADALTRAVQRYRDASRRAHALREIPASPERDALAAAARELDSVMEA